MNTNGRLPLAGSNVYIAGHGKRAAYSALVGRLKREAGTGIIVRTYFKFSAYMRQATMHKVVS
jgi:hypothetical protein